MIKRKKKIHVSFNEEGDATIEGGNFEGDECLHEMRPFEEALGEVGEIERIPDNDKKEFVRKKSSQKNTLKEK